MLVGERDGRLICISSHASLGCLTMLLAHQSPCCCLTMLSFSLWLSLRPLVLPLSAAESKGGTSSLWSHHSDLNAHPHNRIPIIILFIPNVWLIIGYAWGHKSVNLKSSVSNCWNTAKLVIKKLFIFNFSRKAIRNEVSLLKMPMIIVRTFKTFWINLLSNMLLFLQNTILNDNKPFKYYSQKLQPEIAARNC